MCKKDLIWKLGLLSKIVPFGEMAAQKGLLGVKTRLLCKISVLKGVKIKIGHFV